MSRPVAILCGAAVVLLLGSSLALLRPPAPADPAVPSMLSELSSRLEAEVAAREALEREVAALRAALDASRVASPPDPAGPEAPAARAESLAAARSGEPDRETLAITAEAVRQSLTRSLPDGSGPAGRPWFDDARLTDAGLSPREVDTLRGHFERYEMARLELRTQAEREGWRRTPRYRDERRALDEEFAELREELGDHSYDWLLYAAGQANRVQVLDVLESSPAGEAGIQPGDVLLRYDGQPVYDAQAVRQATATGRAGDLVGVDLERAGVPERVWVPRGPLGVRLRAASLPPGPR